MLGRRLDRYIVATFIRYYLYAILAFIAIYLVVNFIETVGKFIERGTDAGVIAEYYLYMIPFVIKWINPIAVLLGVLFCISILSKNSEITAMKSGGISLYRVFLPLIIMGMLISGFIWAWGEVVVPPANERNIAIKLWVFDHKDEARRMETNNFSAYLIGDKLLFAGLLSAYHDEHQPATMISPSLLQLDPEDPTRTIERIDAREAEYGADGQWHFISCEVRTFGSEGEELTFTQTPELVVDIVEKPDEFGILAKTPEDMTYDELSAHIDRLERAGKIAAKERVELLLKIGVPLANLIVVLLGAPLAIRTARSGTALGFGVAVLLGFILWGFIAVGRALGQSEVITPFWAAFFPNILFGITGLFLIWRVNRI